MSTRPVQQNAPSQLFFPFILLIMFQIISLHTIFLSRGKLVNRLDQSFQLVLCSRLRERTKRQPIHVPFQRFP